MGWLAGVIQPSRENSNILEKENNTTKMRRRKKYTPSPISASKTGLIAHKRLDSENHLGTPDCGVLPMATRPTALEAPHCERRALDPRWRNMAIFFSWVMCLEGEKNIGVRTQRYWKATREKKRNKRDGAANCGQMNNCCSSAAQDTTHSVGIVGLWGRGPRE